MAASHQARCPSVISVRLAAYLRYRADRWPNTAKLHLFITVVTARKTTEVHRKRVNTTLGFRAQDLREDRILDEAHASDGDTRRICDLFGLTVGAAQRYIDTLQFGSVEDLDRAPKHGQHDGE